MRFPNFNFSLVEAGDYLFVVSHPVAITGVYACPPISLGMPDPIEEFREELASAKVGQIHKGHEGNETSDGLNSLQEDEEEDNRMFADEELLEVCQPTERYERLWRFRQALVGKFSYFRTIGQTTARKWSQVVLETFPVKGHVVGGSPDDARLNQPRRHHLLVGGKVQQKWRCEVHNWNDYCIVVCRGPPSEALDRVGKFGETQAARYLDIDGYDKALEHDEPDFIEIPIKQLLPEKWHSDYVRACGGGELGEQVRMNDMVRYRPDIPKV